MEECIICFEETKDCEFVLFDCKHKVCTKCYPILIETTSRCPNCDIALNVYPTIELCPTIDLCPPVDLYPTIEIHECKLCKYTNRSICFVIVIIIFIIIYNNNIHG